MNNNKDNHNANITQTPTDIEDIIASIYGSVDNNITYQIQNTGGQRVIGATIPNKDDSKTQWNTIYDLALYKHDDNKEVKLFTLSKYGSSVAITTVGE